MKKAHLFIKKYRIIIFEKICILNIHLFLERIRTKTFTRALKAWREEEIVGGRWKEDGSA
jgi:hypothetical protein